MTDTTGDYAVDNLPAGDSVIVEFRSCTDGSWATQWYKGATTQDQATPIVIPDGGTISSIDATMAPGASPALPEAPLALLLPVGGIAATALVARRRRRRRKSA